MNDKPMTDNVLIRNVPTDLRDWITNERFARKMSQNEFLISLLRKESETGRAPADLPLFSGIPQATQSFSYPTALEFIDLFAGIGGMRRGIERIGGRCVFSCEWDKYSQKTYAAWFGETPSGDIRSIDPKSIPSHHLLAAGFPCQPFSIAGVSKKNSLGRAHGFRDQTQGTLFYNVAQIVEEKQPPVLLLENVKNLRSHDRGLTFKVIEETLSSLGYAVFHEILDAANFGVPQHRERIFIVCFRKNVFGNSPSFKFPTANGKKARLADILEPDPDKKYTLSDHLWQYLQDYARKHKEKGNGFGFGLANPEGVTRTLSARYYKDGSEILIDQGRRSNPRRLTPREAARLMGFDDRLPIVVSDTQAYKQFGNAVVPNVAEAVARQIMDFLNWHLVTNHLPKGRG